MIKKVLQELIENAKQNEKFIYQRYNGIITKYIDDRDCYINCETGIATKKNEHLMLGKISENIIDLIEVGDYVNGHRIKAVYLEGVTKYIKLDNAYEKGKGIRTYEEDIQTILTKEQYEANCYKVGGR